jgi:signal transduction histidine kinase
VDVLAWLDSLFVVLEVRDSASLIGGVERERVFERFYRGSTSRNTAGNGLGLAIVSDIVQQHHGQVGLRTRSDGAGNSFIVYLPRPSLDNDTPEPSQQAFNRPQ